GRVGGPAAEILDAQEGAPEAVEDHLARRLAMLEGKLGSAALLFPVRVGPVVVLARRVPVAVFDGVVWVPARRLPRRELDFGKGAVGKVGADHSTDRIVVDQRTDALLDQFDLVLVFVGARVVGLVLTDRVALVVEDRSAVADPP